MALGVGLGNDGGVFKISARYLQPHCYEDFNMITLLSTQTVNCQ